MAVRVTNCHLVVVGVGVLPVCARRTACLADATFASILHCER